MSGPGGGQGVVSNFSGGVSNFSGGLQFFFGGEWVSNFLGVSNFSGGLQFFGGSLEYGQRSAGTYPTGMHSCFLNESPPPFLNCMKFPSGRIQNEADFIK